MLESVLKDIFEMTDRQREHLGVLAGCAVLLLVLLLKDDVGSTSRRFLSAPGSKIPAPNTSPQDETDFQRLNISFDSGWMPNVGAAMEAQAAGCSVA